MGINLEKGVSIRLKKDSDLLKNVQCNLLWTIDGKHKVDVDVSCLGYRIDSDSKEKLYSEEYFVFYNNLDSQDGALKHLGDERVQGGETVMVNLDNVQPGVDGIAVFITIHDAINRHQHFGLVKSASCQIINEKTGDEIAVYNLKDSFDTMTAVHVGSFYRAGGEWEFKAIGSGMVADLGGILGHYGVKV